MSRRSARSASEIGILLWGVLLGVGSRNAFRPHSGCVGAACAKGDFEFLAP